jgi:hypothetical protein
LTLASVEFVEGSAVEVPLPPPHAARSEIANAVPAIDARREVLGVITGVSLTCRGPARAIEDRVAFIGVTCRSVPGRKATGVVQAVQPERTLQE